MADFQTAFDSNTSGINTTLTTQLSSIQQWSNVPGSLVKASSSAAGYLWGYNSTNLVWICQQPCTGSWSQVDISALTPAPAPVPAPAPAPAPGPVPTSLGTLTGPLIGTPVPVVSVDADDQWNAVYIAYQAPYTKMVNSLGVAKYYTGTPSTYSRANWATYSQPSIANGYVYVAPPVSETIGTMTGNWIKGSRPIIKVSTDDAGNPVYIATDGFIKLVNSKGVGKYYTGTINDYSPSNWSTYTPTPAGSYIATLTPAPAPAPAPPPPPVAPSSPPEFLDIDTDDTNVYLLYKNGSKISLASKTANNQTSWSITSVGSDSFKPISIFSTHTYIWLQADNNVKAKIPKPVTMTNVMSNNDVSVRITSASAKSLYGVDASGNAMRSDETLQTGWSAIKGLGGINVKSLIGDIDETGLFFVDNSSKLSQCVGDCSKKSIVPVNTQGFLPMSVSADPATKQLWMTSTTPGNAGNIFNRMAKPDYTSISNSVYPYDDKRTKVVGDITDKYNQQTKVMTVNKQLAEFQDFFSIIFGKATKAQQEVNTEISQIDNTLATDQAKLNKINSIQPAIQKFVITLAIVGLIYATVSMLGWITHVIVLIVLIVGIYLSLNNDVTLSSLWT